MDLLKGLKLIRERKFCVLWGMHNGKNVKLDEFVAVDVGASVIICDVATKLKCWEVPKIMASQFLKRMFKEYEKVELACY